MKGVHDVQRRQETVSGRLNPVRYVQFLPDGLLPIERGEGLVSTRDGEQEEIHFRVSVGG